MATNVPDQAEEENADVVGVESGLPPATRVPVVGLGGASGALPALSTFFQQVPDAPGVAFVVLVTAESQEDGRLSDLLRQHTRLPIVEVDSTVRVKPDTVYVVPPGAALQMMDDHV